MADSLHEFVADELWLALSIATVAVGTLARRAGADEVASAVFLLGFLLFVPLFLFWGDVIADAALDEAAERDDTVAGEPADASAGETADGPTDADPIEELKREYARGEVDEAEFQRRVERLLALDEVDAADADLDVLVDDPGTRDRGTTTASDDQGTTTATDDGATATSDDEERSDEWSEDRDLEREL